MLRQDRLVTGMLLTALGLFGVGLASGVIRIGSLGAAMPAPPPGWHVTLADNFSGSSLNPSHWYRYSGVPGGDPNGYWDPSHVVVYDGTLVLRTYRSSTPDGPRWVSGGVGEVGARAQTYGRYRVRMQVTQGKGISAIALVFPLRGWPPEVDFYEDSPTGQARTDTSATLHYSSGDQRIQRQLDGVDFSRWHTLGLDWSPHKLVYSIDGRVWASVTSPHVPAQPMPLDLQTQALTCSHGFSGCPDATTPREVDMKVDWVVAYAHD